MLDNILISSLVVSSTAQNIRFRKVWHYNYFRTGGKNTARNDVSSSKTKVRKSMYIEIKMKTERTRTILLIMLGVLCLSIMVPLFFASNSAGQCLICSHSSFPCVLFRLLLERRQLHWDFSI